ncbi:hypothetical protein TWF694_003795 [Orbilia ellipsospora]|uniref:Uncharacterized protein n=1 Tax=Orbilia ellipsospora TaxID=2528407 RepID=A0AAV9X097_9PEZI
MSQSNLQPSGLGHKSKSNLSHSRFAPREPDPELEDSRRRSWLLTTNFYQPEPEPESEVEQPPDDVESKISKRLSVIQGNLDKKVNKEISKHAKLVYDKEIDSLRAIGKLANSLEEMEQRIEAFDITIKRQGTTIAKQGIMIDSLSRKLLKAGQVNITLTEYNGILKDRMDSLEQSHRAHVIFTGAHIPPLFVAGEIKKVWANDDVIEKVGNMRLDKDFEISHGNILVDRIKATTNQGEAARFKSQYGFTHSEAAKLDERGNSKHQKLVVLLDVMHGDFTMPTLKHERAPKELRDMLLEMQKQVCEGIDAVDESLLDDLLNFDVYLSGGLGGKSWPCLVHTSRERLRKIVSTQTRLQRETGIDSNFVYVD